MLINLPNQIQIKIDEKVGEGTNPISLLLPLPLKFKYGFGRILLAFLC
jgi:hypothetical protein